MTIVEAEITRDQNSIKDAMGREDDEISIVDMFLEQVKANPDSIAVSCNGVSITYEEFYFRCLNVYSYLNAAGVQTDSRIGIYIDPSIDQLVAIWGTMMAGGAYLPLSPDYPSERIKYIVKDSQCNLIITEDRLKKDAEELFPENVKIISYSECVEYAKNIKDINWGVDSALIAKDGLAYVIYTSGSTGNPKGVMVEHHSVSNQVRWLERECGLNQNAIILHKTPMSFDAAQCEILSLACGSEIVVGEKGSYREPDKLIDAVRKNKVTILICVPTLLQALVDTELLAECQSLKVLYSGGEALHKKLAQKVIELLPNCTLINMYGPTECTINASALRVDQSVIEASQDIVSIGYPLDKTKYFILDENGDLTPEGDIGELHISGEGVARGYLNRPDLTAQKFLKNPFSDGSTYNYLYKTGDLCRLNSDGSYQFAGRTDNQVKLRGYRIELDEIMASIETHDWVKRSALVVKSDERTGYENLIAFVELDPAEAALMDQGKHLSHHQSKENKTQVLEQISGNGYRDLSTINKEHIFLLPSANPSKEQLDEIYSRKSYRFYEGEKLTANDILELLSDEVIANTNNNLTDLSYEDFGKILRYFASNTSNERLLPKYAYASPGALYATQMYFEIDNLFGLESGYYYYDARQHALVLIKSKESSTNKSINIHFVGKRSAIESVYKNNILEVLEIEVGHMIGLFEKVLNRYGYFISDGEYEPSRIENLDVSSNDFYLGMFSITGNSSEAVDNLFDIYVQTQGKGVEGLKSRMYAFRDSELEEISDDIILRKHVIAINQAVYDRSSVGISIVSKTPKEWRSYIDLGRKLQKLQMNNLNIGLMSSGYSSKTGNDLPSAKFMKTIIKDDMGPFYFGIGGRVSESQWLNRGMKEDTVHMKGPAEMLKDDLANRLPDYMLPNKVMIIKEMPVTVNGKVDLNKLKSLDINLDRKEYVAPRNDTEKKLAALWAKHLKAEEVSIADNFFELGGNSLIAVALVNNINAQFDINLPLQVLFEYSNIERLATKVSTNSSADESRVIPLQAGDDTNPIYCWPGLGGYCMNLRKLATEYTQDQAFFGIQAYGINKGESPYKTIVEMAKADVEIIKRKQAKGPYTLWGYSFGARVAFETAYQLEQSGEEVAKLVLIAPGSPRFDDINDADQNHVPNFKNRTYVTVLCSVFKGGVDEALVNKCLESVHDRETFVDFITQHVGVLERDVIDRVVSVCIETFEFKYTFNEMNERKIKAPISIIKATGDDYSFLEGTKGYADLQPNVRSLSAGHYDILKDPDINELIKALRDVGA